MSSVDPGLGSRSMILQTRFIENSSGQCELVAMTERKLVRNSSHGLTFRLGQRWRIFEFILMACVFAKRWIHGVQVIVEIYISLFHLISVVLVSTFRWSGTTGFEEIDKLPQMKKD
jgi:hypothetical protein